MITAMLANAIEPVAAGKAVGNARGEAQRILPRLEPGQTVSARIETRFPDGSFKVMVAGQEMRLALPAYFTAGETLELIFLAHEPRPTFALQHRPVQTASAAVLSVAGRLVAAMLPHPGEPAVVAALASAPPLLASAPADGAALSASLQHALARSGLFYEAHQADWVAGKLDLAQLRGEPQAKFPQNAPQAMAALAQSTAAALPVATSDSSKASGAPRAQQLMPPQGLPLVQQQLAALESGRLLLQLEVWPSQWMQWEVEERARDSANEAQAPANWQTRLRLDLPQMGELNAVVNLGGNRVQIRLDAASPASAKLLHQHRDALHAALARAGMDPAGIAIDCHEPS